ncbi:MAG: dephospho-CoA kinase [Pseudonocardiales bacterium]|nr:dephospho-CoA kinase [Pseudonocardiales bacterium]MBV9031156.1 dephospho-CoA kinase [Pseudonocardiales bacterium]
MLRVGLTGGIGSGKSMVAARLAQCGAWVIDSDRVAREVIEPGTAGLRAVAEEFGAEILAEDGALNRAALAARVFNDADARGRLNAIVHPLVAARSAELVAVAPPDAVVVQDVPLLVEAGMVAGFPLVVVVHADTDVRLRRLVERRGMAGSDAAARIAAQATDAQRRAAADVWLDNSGCREDTLAAVDRLWARRLVPFEDNLRHSHPAPRAAAPVLVASDDSWSPQAQRMITRVEGVAAGRALRVDHIGSTSVPGLDAKDVLDVQVVVADIEVARRLSAELSAVGLVKPAGRWWDNARDGTTWDKAYGTNADPARDVNCHIRPAGSPTWREAVLLRDWLRAHPDGAREYAELKHRLAARQWDSIDAYASAKTPFVYSALDRAQRWAARTGWLVA